MKTSIFRTFMIIAIGAVITFGFGACPNEAEEVSVTGVTLDLASKTLIEGEGFTLAHTVTPPNATNKKVTWESSNPAIATVGQDGKVTAVKDGNATITVTTDDGDKKAECKVTVNAAGLPALAGNVTIDGTAKVGQTLTANTDSLDGTGDITYQWKRAKDGTTTDIPGTNSRTYVVQAADVGFTITVTVTRPDRSSSKTSVPTATVIPGTLGGNVAITFEPDTETVCVGTELTAEYDGSEDVSFQWEKDGVEDGEDSATFTPTEAGNYTVTVSMAGYNSKTSTAVEVKEHEWDDWTETTAPTCSARGVETGTCKHNNDHTTTRSGAAIVPTAHDYRNYIVTTAPTCSAEGVETGTCFHDATHKDPRPIDIDPTAHQWHFNTSTSIETGICEHNLSQTRLKDSRDGKTYKIVKIGDQTWMAENLNYNATGSVWSNNLEANGDKYGRLYNWATAMGLDTSYNTTSYTSGEKHQGIAPAGWHIPSYAEWNVLIAFVHSDNELGDFTSGSSALAGKYLKAESGWNGTNGEDTYGFSALPGGSSSNGTSFLNVGNNGYWWSSTQSGSSNAYDKYMAYNDEAVWYNNIDKSRLYSVRCVMDE